MLLSLLSKRTLRADFRDAYGFTVRPQYLEAFKEFDAIYRVESNLLGSIFCVCGMKQIVLSVQIQVCSNELKRFQRYGMYSRDAYGFTVRPQYLEAFKEFDAIYRSEEEERATKWECFLEEHEELKRLNSVVEENVTKTDAEVTEIKTDPVLESSGEADDPVLESSGEADDPVLESCGEADVLGDTNPTIDPVPESSGEAN
nr:TBC1 domain family member 8B-like [Tanacetum cinerariifolium]